MSKWKSKLNHDSTDWLLEKSNPSVRYFTLLWLLDKTDDDAEVIAASEDIAQSDSIQRILARQRPEGYWGSDRRPHHGTRGYLALLMWLGYRGNDRVHTAMDYRLNGCVQEDGSYAVEIKERAVYLPCHGANLLRMMLWFGYRDDPRAIRLLNWLMSIQDQEGAWPCVSKLRPFTCYWATADVLRTYRDLPRAWITSELEDSRQRAVELLLSNNLHGKQAQSKISQRWFQFGFPLQWDSDILEVLEIIAPFIDASDERIQEPLGRVLEKQDNHGRWPCEKHPKGGRWMKKFVPFETIGEPSKWVTLHAMRMLKTLFRE